MCVHIIYTVTKHKWDQQKLAYTCLVCDIVGAIVCKAIVLLEFTTPPYKKKEISFSLHLDSYIECKNDTCRYVHLTSVFT